MMKDDQVCGFSALDTRALGGHDPGTGQVGAI
jgi:hypothetical protein